MPVCTLNVTQPVIARTSVAIQKKKGISTCVDQSPHMPAITQQAYQHAKSNPLICQRRHKTNLNMCWPNPPLSARAGNPSQHVLNKTAPMRARTQTVCLHKPLQWKHWRKTYLNWCRPNPYHASEDKKRISTCVEKIHFMRARIKKVSQPSMKNPPNAGGDKKYNSTSVDQTHAIPA